VNINGQLMAAANGQVASFEHLAYFQYMPVGAAQTEALLAPGGAPVAGNNTVTSYDTGNGTFSAVRTRSSVGASVLHLTPARHPQALESNTMMSWMVLRAAGVVRVCTTCSARDGASREMRHLLSIFAASFRLISSQLELLLGYTARTARCSAFYTCEGDVGEARMQGPCLVIFEAAPSQNEADIDVVKTRPPPWAFFAARFKALCPGPCCALPTR